MIYSSRKSPTLFLAALIIGTIQNVQASTNPIVVKGNLLYDSITKKRFYIRGVTYAPNPICTNYYDDAVADDYSSPYLDIEADLRDIVSLNVNTIRLYQVQPDKSHAIFMALAESLGLYVLVPLTGTVWGYLKADVPSPNCYSDEIDGYGNVGSNLVWNAKAVIAEFSGYPNTLMFVAGNELMLHNGGPAFPCLKALVRDLHAFQSLCEANMRRVPLIYATQDMGQPVRKDIGDYLTCTLESEDDALDAFGLNIYAYCDNGEPFSISSSYYAVNQDFQNYRTPFVYTEFGCTQAREFTQVPIMMDEMSETLSGGLAYEYSDHGGGGGYGLAITKGTSCASANGGTVWKPGAKFLQAEYAKTGAYESKASNVGTWGESDRCTWLPPSEQVHSQPACTTNYATWSMALPPTPPEYVTVECPSHVLSATELEENMCHSEAILTQEPSHQPTLQPIIGSTQAPTFDPTAIGASRNTKIGSENKTEIPAPIDIGTSKHDPNTPTAAATVGIVLIVLVVLGVVTGVATLSVRAFRKQRLAEATEKAWDEKGRNDSIGEGVVMQSNTNVSPNAYEGAGDGSTGAVASPFHCTEEVGGDGGSASSEDDGTSSERGSCAGLRASSVIEATKDMDVMFAAHETLNCV